MQFALALPRFFLSPSSSFFASSASSSISLFRRPFSAKCATSPAAMAYEHELSIATKAVSLACRLCQKVQKGLLAAETQEKSDKSPVTVADYGSQALISWALNEELPQGTFSLDSEELKQDQGASMLDRITQLVNETLALEKRIDAPFLSKEQVLLAIDRGRSEGGSVGRHWVLDPIDGTRGFVRGDQYAVALGLLDQGEVVVGVLGCPNLPTNLIGPEALVSPTESSIGCLFAARKGAGTTVKSIDGSIQPQKISVRNLEDPSLANFCESYESAHSMQNVTAEIAKILGVVSPPLRIDSQAKYGAMARGDAAIYLRFPHPGYREKIWDHAAGCIIIKEAGGLVLDAAGNPLDFSKGRYLDIASGIISTNPQLMPALLAAVQAALQKEHHHGERVHL
ncbi:hypothetical protein O6H91_15G034800 [Diphasiastrum complanatum]|uniref:Uncharacterized protein n=1 Tax=Diphasiastrum complanatum TaxID=34168 RepID=A0ACC2BH85_DIPCM|nr:hypothetical protein O6H91_15G034800 [Diphasiastrum complanatum]